MTDHSIRCFPDDASVRRIGHALLDCTLPRAEWTHEAHLAACLWLLAERPDVLPERDLPAIIRAYNVSAGGVNDDHQGYHETLTQLYIRGVRAFLVTMPSAPLVEQVNALLVSTIGRRDWPLQFYSRERLFSVAARRDWIEPDLAAFQPFVAAM
ncbi:hypothetical protein [Novosphingobium sp.]|jgi:hypothetical protein|uniref:hypothetical protein n=1 Tax=Novosphingobium sp. TaxID=1874826 RepID=UPI0022CBCFA2|nr:hypothetical protein [Novosphingobium sp.]MCZ8019609.1 hypothetical protein [Novosphingobium sp.]MCZ8035424.1 hypothetical protein [Novosphingobium sp.]MCZ8050738.1 hypothetical protein [Novosphingobium sp.]MCZ8059084.1 hypothetical protein [Novosphingobium sp.]MCZ8232530.1 hypothetical protein [Novosphingobium sp.]